MYIWTSNYGQRSACSYYRILVPMLELERLGYAKVFEDKGDSSDASAMALMYADIAHWYSLSGEAVLHKFQSIKRREPAKREGQDIYPPALIYDIDDNNDFVHPFNMTFAFMGVRGYPDARLLKPGEGLDIIDPEGRQIAAWVDKETTSNTHTFDVARNLHQMKVRHAIIREAHGVTVPSPTLAKYMREVIGAKSVYVFPNTIVPEHYEKIRAVRGNPDEIRILWQGGMSHWIDWYPLRNALKEVSQRYPNIKWVIFGEWFNWIHENIPDSMVEHHPWVEYDAYKLKRGLLNIDINLCPLVANAFNACKSAIKWYESILWEKPEATLAAKSPTYSEIVDDETGLLYTTPEEFAAQLGVLIENAELRQRLANNAKKWVLANRTPEHTIPGLHDYYSEVRAKQKRDIGAPIIKQATFAEIKQIARPMR